MHQQRQIFEGVCKLIELFCQAAGITISGKRFVQGSLF
nr:MAG TPA: hypothetical protein [Caudoviricetes sp.]